MSSRRQATVFFSVNHSQIFLLRLAQDAAARAISNPSVGSFARSPGSP